MKSHYEQLFEKETGKQVWLPTWSEKHNEQREYLNPDYCKWINNYIENIINDVREQLCEPLSNKYNRRLGQVMFLYELCDYNFEKLCSLEEKIKNNHIHYCPGDKEEIEKIINKTK